MTITDIFNDIIELTDERWQHIVREHPEVESYKGKIQEVLSSPDYVKKSKRDKEVLLYYRHYDDILDGKYLLVAVKKGLRSFILTCYITDIIKKGESLWEKK
ncbi:MAG: hypothetical protein A2W05_02640 [Candidatus Schekmanbacteria bacterium RBG_16_38_10]|uniref:Phage-Barnase-EndoU-ColicinE5/D-RelE like nuclease 2 domain-containing protein n=1 Tax=Candidatus Schekmanbacteria bacterium RBG_16_38_10 TaxID=1817879 RepID=A0A1F7RMF4_9BACT|nr:MAG: hypothetical protein A2W05_02640 [Candidatus Schekmanbacteria bacterium RBG_16_38_10]